MILTKAAGWAQSMSNHLRNRKFVTIGNGTGQATLLKHLHLFIDDLSVIVGVTDNGGHSGLLRRIMNIPAPGDIRNCVNAIAPEDNIISKLLGYRFNCGELSGCSLGNLILAALTDIEGDMGSAMDQLTDQLGINAKIMPASNVSTQICAEIEDGTVIEGEFEIIRRENKDLRIVRLFHKPEVDAYEPALKAIDNADVIIIAPGTLRTGIISTLLARGMKESLAATRAKIVFVCNIMTNPGQTEDFSAQDHIDEITRYMGRKPDYALIHSGQIPSFIQEIYLKERSYPVKHINIDHKDIKIIIEDLLDEIDSKELSKYERVGGKNIKTTPHLIRHNSKKLMDIIMDISNN